MPTLSEVYRSVFIRLRGKGMGIGLFNRLHKWVWEDHLQPEWVEVHGFKLYLPKHGEDTSDILRMGRPWEPEVTAEFQARLAPGMVALDLGANLGYYTVLASRLVGPSGRVLAFEPETSNLAILMKNIEMNGCSNVSVYPYAVGSSLAFADLHLCRISPGFHSLFSVPKGTSGETTRVVVVPLDQFLEASVCPDFVKIDIEGGEIAALQGMRRLLENPRLKIVVVECNGQILGEMGKTPKDILNLLEPHGFSFQRLDNVNFLCTR